MSITVSYTIPKSTLVCSMCDTTIYQCSQNYHFYCKSCVRGNKKYKCIECNSKVYRNKLMEQQIQGQLMSCLYKKCFEKLFTCTVILNVVYISHWSVYSVRRRHLSHTWSTTSGMNVLHLTWTIQIQSWKELMTFYWTVLVIMTLASNWTWLFFPIPSISYIRDMLSCLYILLLLDGVF